MATERCEVVDVDVVARQTERLGQRVVDEPDDVDQLCAGAPRIRRQLRGAYEALAAQVETLDDAALRATVRGRDHSVETMIRGVVEHGVYHGGQVALLKRALESAPARR
jgi:uncharacterized damage-inducible protein DinB